MRRYKYIHTCTYNNYTSFISFLPIALQENRDYKNLVTGAAIESALLFGPHSSVQGKNSSYPFFLSLMGTLWCLSSVLQRKEIDNDNVHTVSDGFIRPFFLKNYVFVLSFMRIPPPSYVFTYTLTGRTKMILRTRTSMPEASCRERYSPGKKWQKQCGGSCFQLTFFFSFPKASLAFWFLQNRKFSLIYITQRVALLGHIDIKQDFRKKR